MQSGCRKVQLIKTFVGKFRFRFCQYEKAMKKEYEIAMLKWAFSEYGYGVIQKDVQKGLKTIVRVKNPNTNKLAIIMN